MGDIAAATTALLLGTPALMGLVSSRVYPQWSRLVDAVYPAAIYKIEGVSSTQTYGGVDSLTSCTLSIACVGLDAVAVGEIVQTALDGAAGTYAGTVIQGIFLNEDGVSDEVQNDSTSDAILYYVRQLEFLVWFQR